MMRSTLVPLGLLVLSAAAVELHVDWARDGLIFEEIKGKREAVPEEVYGEWNPDGFLAEEEMIRREVTAATPNSDSDSSETEANPHDHGDASKPKLAGQNGSEHGQNGDGGSRQGNSGDTGNPMAQDADGPITVINDPRSGGAPQTITAQSQRATMFIPTLTYCGHALAEQTSGADSQTDTAGSGQDDANADDSAASKPNTGSIGLNKRNGQGKAKQKKAKQESDAASGETGMGSQQASPTATGNANGAGEGGGNDAGCRTLYRSTETPICHTTLRGAGVGQVVVNDCDQQVTFRRESGNGGTTDYIAKWDQVQQDHVPTGTVTVRECKAGSCASSMERWQEATTQAPQTKTVPVTFSEQVTGPATMHYGNQSIAIPSGKTSRVVIHTEAVQTQRAQLTYIKRESLSGSSDSSDSSDTSDDLDGSNSADGSDGDSSDAANFLAHHKINAADQDSVSDSSNTDTTDSVDTADEVQSEITTTVTHYSTATITVTDLPANTGTADVSTAGSDNVEQSNTGDTGVTEASTDADASDGSTDTADTPDTPSVPSPNTLDTDAADTENTGPSGEEKTPSDTAEPAVQSASQANSSPSPVSEPTLAPSEPATPTASASDSSSSAAASMPEISSAPTPSPSSETSASSEEASSSLSVSTLWPVSQPVSQPVEPQVAETPTPEPEPGPATAVETFTTKAFSVPKNMNGTGQH